MRPTMQHLRRGVLISGLSLAFMASGGLTQARASGEIDVASDDLPLPVGDVVLVITGQIARANVKGEAHLDMEMLRALPAHGLLTTTAVTDGARRFDGFLMRDVLNLVGGQGHLVEAQALNDYKVGIPVADFEDYDVLLATHMDGKRLLPSGKGPFWIVYPRDEWRQLQDIRYDYRWVWQLNRLTIK